MVELLGVFTHLEANVEADYNRKTEYDIELPLQILGIRDCMNRLNRGFWSTIIRLDKQSACLHITCAALWG